MARTPFEGNALAFDCSMVRRSGSGGSAGGSDRRLGRGGRATIPGVSLPPLPIDPYVADVVARLERGRALVIVAPPGAGKTTRLPPALVAKGPVLLLQPRRVAARSLARRIAEEQGWTLGREVGWHVRFERRSPPDTRLLVATEGVLTARLQQDPLLTGYRAIVLDEFHERTIHADLAIAMARQAWLARDDLMLLVMSATIDGHGVSRYLGGCEIVEASARPHPLALTHHPP